MCAGALFWSQISEVYFGASDPKRGFRQTNPNMLHPKTQVTSGILAEESEKLVLDFFKKLRE
jgi:tRNA(adenine34) deaminase